MNNSRWKVGYRSKKKNTHGKGFIYETEFSFERQKYKNNNNIKDLENLCIVNTSVWM